MGKHLQNVCEFSQGAKRSFVLGLGIRLYGYKYSWIDYVVPIEVFLKY
jgi:hypothetical protein